jgi:hypothetical protein
MALARKPSATIQLKVRMKEPLRAKIERAAKRRGISLNSEIVDRLSLSFQKEEAKYDEFGGESYYRLSQLLALAVQQGELISGERWFETPQSIDKTAAFVVSFIDGCGRTLGKGPGTSSEIDPMERVVHLKEFAEQLRRNALTEDEKLSG